MTDPLDDLLPYYERELAALRRSLGEFARRHPEAAARLSISGEHSEDPHVERLLQSAALIFARSSACIDDDYPELTTAMLEITYPEYLRPFPSCSIARFEGSDAIGNLTDPFIIERGAELKTRKGEYPFKTVYDVVFAPVRIADARYASATSAPIKVRLHAQTTGIVSITFAARAADALLGSGMPERVRLFVDGDRRTVAAAMDTLLLRASNAFVEADGNGTWIALDAVPVSCAGFHQDEALIDRHGEGRSKFRVLLEFFSFPEKFDFIDIDLSAMMRTARGGRSVTLHLPIQDLHCDSAHGQLLQGLAASNFKLFCTPVINLFAAPAQPVPLETPSLPVYPIVPDTLCASDSCAYRVDAVRLTQDTANGTVTEDLRPYHSLLSRLTDGKPYWLAERGGRLADFVPSNAMLLALVDGNGKTMDVRGVQVDMDLTCTNGDLPASVQIGDPHGDFVYANQTLIGRASMLRSPTRTGARTKLPYQLWDIVAMLSGGPLNLCQEGLPAFKRLLAAHAPSRSTSAQRQIESLKHLAHELALEWIVMKPQPMLVRGIRVRVAIDETALYDCPVSVLARMFESSFVHYAPANSFMQLVLLSARNGAELMRGEPLRGAIALL